MSPPSGHTVVLHSALLQALKLWPCKNKGLTLLSASVEAGSICHSVPDILSNHSDPLQFQPCCYHIHHTFMTYFNKVDLFEIKI